ncbi:MAG: hypothetical protein H0U13_00330 [Gemmatimonadaceae bacterium]|nr:hypothetical protein [Gemmatimonadaceae bacterium]
MADFTQQWIDHLKSEIAGRMDAFASAMSPAEYAELVTDLAWFTFRFSTNPETKMRKVSRD